MAQPFWRIRILLSEMHFHYFVIISPWKRAGPFIWTNLNSLHPRMICAKFHWNWPSGTGVKNFLISSIYFCYFVIISPWKTAGPFIWTNLNNLHSSLHYAKFMPSLVEISPVVLEMKILNWIYFTQGCIVPSLVELA